MNNTSSVFMDFDAIHQLISMDMQRVNKTMLAQLESKTTLINQLGHYIVESGGKRIRPTITLLAANALNYKGNDHIICATFIEFIHTATLLHDDVVDESTMRRGNKTANALFGNAASVLVGDFIYTRAFQLMTQLNNLDILRVMSDATNVISEGEVLQLINCNNPDVDEESYMQVIYSKTARLFEVASQCSAILANASNEQQHALKNYGKFLGTAFQLIDDVLDYQANANTLGKNIGDDLSEGKPTLPLLHAMQHTNHHHKLLIRKVIENGNGIEYLQTILEIMQQEGSLDYTINKAQVEAQKAIACLDALPESNYKDALISLAHLSAERKF